ncbi:hypothetical protein HID58_093756 [Brassica napus]|uniref:Uncharacterized protein n=1 Tax=Brassica napus TaxID=3708 RepID=A0ABQ7X9T4_BRANA|nr:hypothetical protein HID58_093756 [Brassica napus]
MEVLKGFPQGDRGWKRYFFYVRLIKPRSQRSAFHRLGGLWGVGVHNPIPLFRKIYASFETFSVVAACLEVTFVAPRRAAQRELSRSRVNHLVSVRSFD